MEILLKIIKIQFPQLICANRGSFYEIFNSKGDILDLKHLSSFLDGFKSVCWHILTTDVEKDLPCIHLYYEDNL